MKRAPLFLPALIFLAVGCTPQPAAQTSTSPADTTKPSTTDTSPPIQPTASASADTPAANTTKAAGGMPSAAPPKAAPAATGAPSATASGLPAALQHDGFLYSGAQRTQPMDMEETLSTQPGVITGSQSVAFKGLKDGKAVYSVTRTGGLANLGSEEWTVTEKGVFVSKSSMMDMGPMAMELPADPKPGMTWNVHTKVNRPDAKIQMDLKFTVVGKESVTTEAGTFKDALLIKQEGAGTMQSQKARTIEKDWYVKGIGMVKATVDITTSGKKESLTIQETKS